MAADVHTSESSSAGTSNEPDRIRVLHVTGSGRSGSTLLTSTLGSAPKAFAAGEVRYIWERGVLEDGRCGCRSPARTCPVWSKVFDRLGENAQPLRARALQHRLRHITQLRRSARFFIRRRPLEGDERELGAALGAVYRTIADTTGASIIIDSSKLPTYAALLDELPEIDLYVLHLVRDPRAAAWSWMRGRAGATGDGFNEAMDQLSPAKSSLLWSVWNTATMLRWSGQPERYLRVRYEDIMACPRSAVTAIARFAGMDADTLPFVDRERVVLTDGHVLAGNPNRMRHGPVPFEADLGWQTAMAPRDRYVVTAITGPLLLWLGYRWRVK